MAAGVTPGTTVVMVPPGTLGSGVVAVTGAGAVVGAAVGASTLRWPGNMPFAALRLSG